jgi:hypothetical protein
MKRILYPSLLAASLSVLAQGTGPMAHGDRVIGVGLTHSQASGGAVTFTPTAEEFTFRLEMDASGRRTYFRGTDVTPYWVYDKELTRLVFRGMDMAGDERFTMLPPGGEPAAGHSWDVAPHHLNIPSCGRAHIRYKAVASNGPEAVLRIDGQEEKVPTVRVDYTARVECPNGKEPFLRTHELVYAPRLKEIVQSVSVNYDGLAPGPMQLGSQTRGWRLRGVSKAK